MNEDHFESYIQKQKTCSSLKTLAIVLQFQILQISSWSAAGSAALPKVGRGEDGAKGGGAGQRLPDQFRPDQGFPDQVRPDKALPDKIRPDEGVPDKTFQYIRQQVS